MNATLTDHQQAVVRRLIRTGRYKSEEEVLSAALGRLEDLETGDEKRDALRRDIETGIAALERGDYVSCDEQGLKELLEEVKSSGRQRLSSRSSDRK